MPPGISNGLSTPTCTPCGYNLTSGTNINKVKCSPTIPQLTEAVCCNCKPDCGRCNLKPQVKFCKYEQPKKRTSRKPATCTDSSLTKMDDQSVYRLSYLPAKAEKLEQIKPPDNIAVGDAKVSYDTVHNMSFRKYDGALPSSLIVPCRSNFLGNGIMQDITTHKHDYVPKPINVRHSCKPSTSFMCNETPFSDKTTNRLSYQRPLNQVKTQLCKPPVHNQTGCVKMDCNTIHRMSYIPYDPQDPVEKPWMDIKSHVQPQLPMSYNTIYKESYIPVDGDPREKPFRPPMSYKSPYKMEDETIYIKSYQTCEIDVPASCKPEYNPNKTKGAFYGDTTQKLSYQGHENALPASLMKPCGQKHTGQGPMQDITTHKHDYVPKPIDKPQSCRPPPHTIDEGAQVSDKTTNRLSYTPHDLSKVRVKPAKLEEDMPKPMGKIEDKTTHKMSYLPFKPKPKEEFAWVPTDKYCPPTRPMDGNTINSLSYQFPGLYTECSANDRNCIPCPQPTNLAEPCSPGCCCCETPVFSC